MLLSIIVRVKAKPRSSIALTAWSVALVTSRVNWSAFSVIAESTPPLFSDRTVVISLARRLTAVAISSALPTKLRATSSLDRRQACARHRLRCADCLGGGQRKLTERTLGLRRVDLDGLAQLFQPRIECIGSGLAAGLDLARDCFSASDQKVLRSGRYGCRDCWRPRGRGHRVLDPSRRSWR